MPHGTSVRMEYNGKGHSGQIDNGEWLVEGARFNSPSAAAGGVTRTRAGKTPSLDGWIYRQRVRRSSLLWHHREYAAAYRPSRFPSTLLKGDEGGEKAGGGSRAANASPCFPDEASSISPSRTFAYLLSRRARSSSGRFFRVLLNTQGAIKF